MDIKLHIDEVFQMAVQLEENGAEFYQNAARQADDKEVKALLEKLADMEGEHKAIFEKMRAEMAATSDIESMFDPSGEAAKYLKSIVDTKVFFDETIDTSSLLETLREAVWREKDTVVFYLSIRLSMTEESSRLKLDKIIEEEMSHVRIIGEKLKELSE